jgi:hypothetical protein
LLQPSKALFDQPSGAQADGISGVSGGPAVEVAAPSVVVPLLGSAFFNKLLVLQL